MTTRRQLRDARRLRSRRIRAILAGGLVFGLGATATLAAWNDSEFGSGTFTAGSFGIEGAVGTGGFGEHGAATPAALSFTVPVSAMVPGATVYALFRVRTVAGSVKGQVTMAADAANAAGAPGDLGPSLRYSVYAIAGTVCDSSTATTGTQIVAPTSPLTAGGPAVMPLVAGAAGAAGAPVNYCFAVTLPLDASNNAQGDTVTAKWSFDAVSTP